MYGFFRRRMRIVLLWLLPASVLLLAPLTFALTLNLWPRTIGILALAWVLPGILLLAHWRLPRLTTLTAGFIAMGLGLCWMILIALLFDVLPGGIELWPLIMAYWVGAVALWVPLWWREVPTLSPTPTKIWLGMGVLLVLTVMLRLPGLGYRELHSDEAIVLYLARDAIQGEEDALARHTKSPGEIVVAMTMYRALGTLNEQSGRLPFALAGVLAVLATALLGRRLFNPTVGFWAGVLLAFNGFALGLSRLIQYQPMILLLMALSLLAAWEFAQYRDRGWLGLVIVFSTFGLLLHYEWVLVMPVLLFLLWQGWKAAPEQATRRYALYCALLCGIPLLIAYLPLLFNPYFTNPTTPNHFTRRIGDLMAFNIPFFIEISTLYNSIYFFMGLLLFFAAGLLIGWRSYREQTVVLMLAFMPFFILYLFVVDFPGTHYYMMMESWSLLAALSLATLIKKWQHPVMRGSMLAFVVGWLTLSGGYLYLAFFREVPEYIINLEETRSPLYWAPTADGSSKHWSFGFPILEGWKTLGVLAEWHYMGQTYSSNDLSDHIKWYVGGLERVDANKQPDLFFLATHQRTPNWKWQSSHIEGYQQIGEVRVRGTAHITIWAREPQAGAYLIYDAELFETVFDGVVPTFKEWPLQALPIEELASSSGMRLKSAALSKTTTFQGKTLHLVLNWQPEQALERDYKLFVHVGHDENGQPLTQWDGLPGQNTARTSQWSVGETFEDHVLLKLPEDMPLGQHPISVGFYDSTTGERLDGQAYQVGSVTVKEDKRKFNPLISFINYIKKKYN
jgi:4-amino-4-deoxy-L-arabinose transferase-like glycosyltransferase